MQISICDQHLISLAMFRLKYATNKTSIFSDDLAHHLTTSDKSFPRNKSHGNIINQQKMLDVSSKMKDVPNQSQ